MATTGLDLYRLFQLGVDKPYSGYVDPTKATTYFKQSYYKVINDIYRERLNNQNAFDELSYLLSLNTNYSVPTGNEIYHSPIPLVSVILVGATILVATELPHELTFNDTFTITGTQGTLSSFLNATFTVSNVLSATTLQAPIGGTPSGTVTNNTGTLTSTKMVSDYLHYLWGEATFADPLYTLTCTGYNTTPARILVNKRNKLRDGDKIRIAGFTTGNINGDFYVKYLNEFLLSLYTDVTLQTPVVGAAITGTGTITQLTTNEMKMKLSDQKGNYYGEPTVNNPYYQLGKLKISIYPLEIPCESITIDYVRKPPREIDASNTVIDYEKYYPYYFLEKIAVEAGRLFSGAARDGSLQNVLSNQIIENP